MDCPDCGSVMEAIAAFCPSCGTNVANATRRRELEALLAEKQHRLAMVEALDPRRDADVKRLRIATISAGAWMSVGLLAVFYSLELLGVIHEDYANLIVLGVQVAFIITLSIIRRAFSFSALMACVTGLAMFLPLFELQPLVLQLVILIAALALGSSLGRYGGWVWGLVVLMVISAVGSTLILVYGSYWDNYIVVLAYPGFPLLQALFFGLLSLRAWWLTHRIEHQVAAIQADKQSQIEYLRNEIWQLSREIEALRQ